MTHLLNDIYCVEVAEDAREHRINYEHNGTPHFMADLTGGYYHDIELPMGRWQFLFLSNQVTEERARMIMHEDKKNGWLGYISPTGGALYYDNALEPFHMMMKLKNLTGNQAIIQKIK